MTRGLWAFYKKKIRLGGVSASFPPCRSGSDDARCCVDVPSGASHFDDWPRLRDAIEMRRDVPRFAEMCLASVKERCER